MYIISYQILLKRFILAMHLVPRACLQDDDLLAELHEGSVSHHEGEKNSDHNEKIKEKCLKLLQVEICFSRFGDVFFNVSS